MTDFSKMVPHGTIGADVDNFGAANLASQGLIRRDASYQAGKNQTNFLTEQRPQLRSQIAATGQHYGTAAKVAMGNQQRHYQDSQYDIFRGAGNALDQLILQQAYQATGLIVGG